MLISAILSAVENGSFDKTFEALYHDTVRPRRRYAKLIGEFLERYGDREGMLFSVPGRTEISGNHTDHNNGCVLAASVDIDIIAVAAKTEGMTVRLKSEGYPEDTVDCSDPNPKKVRKGSSSALVTGVCDAFAKKGYAFGGFDACTSSDVLTGSGLSSSAAFEVMCARIISQLYNDGKVPPMELALAGQYAENVYFGKPCGLMDQAACACGGFLYIDFENPKAPKTEKLSLDPEKAGYTICIVNTGGNHVDLTDDYAAVPKEMHACAALMGKKVLRECDETEFLSRISYMRANVGDRAILRAIHYFDENKRVEAQRAALKSGDADTFFRLVTASGRSSFEFLQNVYTTRNVSEQGISLALALSLRFGAVCRVHGGGFAGTIQAYVPTDKVEAYRDAINNVFGKNACMLLRIRPYGASAVTPEGVLE
ncbi:MAG: galactokinase [Clostridia bacterium]|nr:galactokinase [Clostridia bacterium]